MFSDEVAVSGVITMKQSYGKLHKDAQHRVIARGYDYYLTSRGYYVPMSQCAFFPTQRNK